MIEAAPSTPAHPMRTDLGSPTLAPGVAAWVARGEQVGRAEADRRATMRQMHFDTIAVHGIYGMEAALANNGSIIEPAYLSPAQHFADSDHLEAALAYLMPAWGYTRIANPTTHYLEETLALLETYRTNATASACVTSSGMAAVHLATSPFLSVGSDAPAGRPNVVVSAKCYGGTFMLFTRYATERGVNVRWVRNPLDLDDWASKIDGQTRFVYGEMPSNPALAVFDIPAVTRLAHDADIPLIVDSTVATPALLRPISLGADIVVHSLSKMIAGSGMAIAGALIARHGLPGSAWPDEMREDFATYVKLLPARDLGPALSPLNALLAMSDLRTLRARVDAWSRSAEIVVAYLATHPAVEAVDYPGLVTTPGHEIAMRDMWLADGGVDGEPVNRFGSLLSFVVRGGSPAARRTFDRLELIWRATDLGRIKSVATIPAISTHQQQGEAGRGLAGVPDGQIRLSIGGEHPADLIADLNRALEGSL
jgi:O-acetylhomoserine/O-acetylserine sulfhydrylase-like pyridoxal-dependent enzyme